MSDQQPAVVEETTKVGVEEVPQATSSESSSGSAEAVAPESSQPSNTASPSQSAETGDATPAEATVPSTPEGDTPEPLSIHTLKVGQHITGRVKNIANFGAFVDIGIPQDGLVHISKLSRRKVEKVTDVVSEGQEVDVWVQKVDKRRGRISLTMIKPIKLKLRDIKEGDELEGTITRLESYGAFVDIGSDRDGLVHISQVTHDYIKHPNEVLVVGDKVVTKVLKVNRKKRQVDLSIKALLPPPPPPEEEVKKEEVVEEVKVVEELIEEEELMPTAMAVAYAAFRSESQSSRQAAGKDLELTKGRGKKKREMDAIVARTLAARQD